MLRYLNDSTVNVLLCIVLFIVVKLVDSLLIVYAP